MKKQYFKYIVSALILVLSLSSCQKNLFETPVQTPSGTIQMNPDHPMKVTLQTIVDKYVGKGLPGVQVAVKNSDGWYFTSGGFTKVESKSTFNQLTPTWLFSITKTYTAALVMKQKERGLIDLDASIARYLPADILKNIDGHDKITTRMLLSHSSGLTDFIELPAFLAGQFNNPLHQPSLHELLEMLKDQKLRSTPGEEYYYSNTNYLLLTLILEKLTGKTYQQLLEVDIFQPLHLQHTYLAPTEEQTFSLGFPNYYVDRYAKDQLENATAWNSALGRACIGWGGIAATSSDAILFYEALMNGQVVSNASLQEMKTWFQGKSSPAPDYGFGLEYFQYADGSTPQVGHEGDGIGSSTMLLYVPDNNTYLFINVTVGRKLFGPYLYKITDFKNELCKAVAEWR